MKTKELINELKWARDNCANYAHEDLDEIIQKLLEYEELKRLALETIDAQEGMFLFLMTVLSSDLEGVEFFQEEENE